MSKKVFILIVALMSISLIGIILVQLYWIDNAVESKKAQFKNEVQKSLGSVSQKIISKEELEFEKQIENLIKDKVTADNAQIKNYLFQQWILLQSSVLLSGQLF
jgi:two-component system phosphate regulon sensor histidine kinase PhoR